MTPRTGDDWWRGAVIYQIYPRSFQDSNDDGIGDLKGATRRLGHVADLGADAIWLSPFFTSPMADMGYDVSDFRGVDPIFGTIEDFDALVAEAHRLGLKVIIDKVLSHTSDKHPWFVESRHDRTNPKADWYVWADAKDDGTAPNNWLSVFGGPAWEWDSVRKQYYMHNFLTSQPDLNFHNEEVQQELLDATRFWLERGVDGFRLDTVNFYFHDRLLRDNPPMPRGANNDIPDTNPYGYQDHVYDKTQPENLAFLRRFRALLNEYDARASVGEVGDGLRSLKTVGEYTSGGDKLHMCYTFDMLSPAFSAEHVRNCVEAFETSVPDGWVCWAFSNHDVKRHVSRWTGEGVATEDVAKFSIALLACLRGSICLYQGEELGLTEAEIAFEDLRDPYGIRFWPGFKGRDGCRTPMVWEADGTHGGFSAWKPWLPVPLEHRALAVDRQEDKAGSVLEFYREMLALRKSSEALVFGDIAFVDGTDRGVLAFWREHAGERVLCAFNFDPVPSRFELPEEQVMQLDGPSMKSGATVEGRTITLPPLGWLIARMPSGNPPT